MKVPFLCENGWRGNKTESMIVVLITKENRFSKRNLIVNRPGNHTSLNNTVSQRLFNWVRYGWIIESKEPCSCMSENTMVKEMSLKGVSELVMVGQIAIESDSIVIRCFRRSVRMVCT